MLLYSAPASYNAVLKITNDKDYYVMLGSLMVRN